MERPEAKYFCNKCGYVGPNSQHENCSYFACTSLEYQYIEQLERQLAERDAEITGYAMQESRQLDEVYEQLAAKNQQIALLRKAMKYADEALMYSSHGCVKTIRAALAATEEKK